MVAGLKSDKLCRDSDQVACIRQLCCVAMLHACHTVVYHNRGIASFEWSVLTHEPSLLVCDTGATSLITLMLGL